MLKERLNVLHTLLKVGTAAGAAWMLTDLAFGAANAKTRKRVRERANGFCEDCGKEVSSGKMIVGHLNHDSNNGRNDQNNLKGRCPYCEAEYHIQHADKPGEIGLRKVDNDAVVYGYFCSLLPEQQIELYEMYKSQIDGVFKRMRLDFDPEDLIVFSEELM
ncbi:MAG: HNH endonuclease [Patescibacteria group bacterium]|jgi:DNA-directed RNA polymerase subunit RPC12/RpoP